ncbi:MucR family transcriptional regulator [Novosphingobium sp. BL-52-GroH]|uniref:MucR family transcriptional regulator n=1 Tax=Novosphingobium sp. BL-52-GroH TaxID=3349877 RepID=UPI0038512F23
MADTEQPDLTTLTVQLLSAYVANNSVASSELADLIQTTRTALAGEAVPDVPAPPEHVAAVSVRKSLSSRDHLLSLIDGKPYKTLKRHLASHGLTPAEYRERYNLAKDYPMVAPSYSDMRREVSVRLGLGRRPAVSSSAEAPAEVEAAPVTTPVKAKAKSAPKKAPATAVASSPETPAASTPSASPAKSAAPKPEGKPAKPARKAKPKAAAPEAGTVADKPVDEAAAAPSTQPDAAPAKARARKASGAATPATDGAPAPRRRMARSKTDAPVAKAPARRPRKDKSETEA